MEAAQSGAHPDAGNSSSSVTAQPSISETASEKTSYIWEIHQNTLPVPVIPPELFVNAKDEPDRDTSVSILDLQTRIQSSTFIRGQMVRRPSEWQLHLQRKKQEGEPDELELVLNCRKLFTQINVPVWARASCEIIDESGNSLKSYGSVFEVEPKQYTEGMAHVMSLGTKSELQSKLTEYFSEGILRFRVRLNIYLELPPIQNPLNENENDGKPPTKRRRLDSPSKMSLTGLLGSLDDLWSSREQAGDVTIKCRGIPIKAHKFILSSRSNVFKGMLDSPMATKEKETMEVDVNDISPETMNILLEFLYLGDSMQFDWSNIDEICALVYASEKYWVIPLMNKCYQTLIKMMTFENFWKVAHVAFLFDSGKEFKNEVRHFYECNQMTLNGVPSFRNFAHENFDEFYKLFFYRISD